jgi:hypothetical protein
MIAIKAYIISFPVMDSMSKHFIEMILRHKRIIPVVVALVGIAAYMIPTNSLALAAITGSGNVAQTISQSNSISATNTGKYGGAFADNNVQTNTASNSAFVSLVSGGGSGGTTWSGYVGGGGSIKNSGNVLQTIDQSNSISASNTGDFGTASASGNTQSNDASNTASVDISSHGGKHGGSIKDSGNVLQTIDQSNSISASNSGTSGTATADHNTQSNDASNTASVDISSHGSNNHNGDKKSGDNHNGDKKRGGSIKDSGNVVQSASQSNSVSASNSGDHGTASASGNSQSNSASNSADVHIKTKH